MSAAEVKRVYLDIDEELHKQLKAHALENGQTLKRFCEEALFNAMKGVKKRGSKKKQTRRSTRKARK